ncbi:MAG: FHA domain-containing protein [Prevotella sp.]|nr:FHA domain-containing protein [Prevotella sp.]
MRLLKIGRDAACDITINSPKVSSLHAELTLLNSGDILLEDKGSKNGTYVQNQPIQPGKTVNVRRGDAIRFADVELQWSSVPIEDNSGYKGVWGIGTNFHNDFQIAGNTVSRFHATVKQANDGKFYIFDHSKNGTTVNGTKVMPNQPFRIKKNSAISCGGVPVNLTAGNKIPWGSDLPKILLASAAALLLLCGIGFGVYKLLDKPEAPAVGLLGQGDSTLVAANSPMTDEAIYEKYKSSVVFLQGVFHYKVTAGDLDLSEVGMPTSVLPIIDPATGTMDYDFTGDLSADEILNRCAAYSGTGFFISEKGEDEGKLITNLHVVKPWLFDKTQEQLESLLKQVFAKRVQDADFMKHLQMQSATTYSAYISQIKVEGVLDKIILVPFGKRYEQENYKKCVVLSCGESDPSKDVALLQIVDGELPKGCSYVDVDNFMDISDDALRVTKHVCTLGFPFGTSLQNIDNEKGLQIYFNGGSINKDPDIYHLFMNAVSFHGASGSPVFNEYGKLVGVLDKGADQSQGFNAAMKAKYVRELLDAKPYKK